MDPNDPTQTSVPPSGNQVFPPPTSPTPTVPNLSELNETPVVPSSPVSPPPTTPPPVSSTFTPTPDIKESRFNFKKIGIVFGLLAIIGLFIYLVVMLVLPRLGLFQKEVHLTWWGLWEDEAIVAPIIEEYQSQNPNVKISYTAQAKEDYRERLTNALAEGSGPDIFRFHNSWVPMFYNSLAPVPAEIISSEEFSQTFYPVAISDLTTAKGFVGIPLEYDGLGLFINEEIFATYTKTPPTTWDELKDTALALTIVDQNGIVKQSGVALGRTENVDHWPEIVALMLLQNGGSINNPSDHLAEGALAYYASFDSVYKIWDETLPPSTTFFANGKLAMYFAPSWRAIEILSLNPNLKFKIVPVPQLPKDSATEPDITYASYWIEGVSEESNQKLEAFKFLKYLSTKETLQKLYGLEAASAPNRPFGEPYPRVDMKDLLTTDPYLGGVIALAGSAKSGYLASRTFDGPSGINSRLVQYYKDAINAIGTQGVRASEKILETLSLGVQQVLSDYGLVAPPATPAP